MAAEKISSEAGIIIVDGDPIIVDLASDAGADAKPGYLVEQTAINTCGANAVGGIKPMGVAKEHKQLDIDSAFAAGVVVEIYLLGCGVLVRSFMDIESSATVYSGQLAIAGNSTSGAWDLAGAMTNSDIRELVGRVGRYDATVDGSLRVGHLMLSI